MHHSVALHFKKGGSLVCLFCSYCLAGSGCLWDMIVTWEVWYLDSQVSVCIWWLWLQHKENARITMIGATFVLVTLLEYVEPSLVKRSAQHTVFGEYFETLILNHIICVIDGPTAAGQLFQRPKFHPSLIAQSPSLFPELRNQKQLFLSDPERC